MIAVQRNRSTQERISGLLREADAGSPVDDPCRKHGFREPTYFAWTARIGGTKVSDAQRLNALESENPELGELRGR